VAHVTFVHGIGNKPEEDVLLEQWRVALLDNDGVDLDALGVTCSMVYWADLLYDKPASSGAGHESSDLELEQSVDAEDADMSWLTEVPPEERDFVERLGREIGLATVIPGPEETPDPVIPESPLEAVPLPPWLKRRLMRVFLRDVHHYLYDATFSARLGEPVRIRPTIRSRALEALRAGAARPGPHLVIGHSLGSVIAYDVLTGVAETPPVDGLITVGSPLGISEVQEALAPPWTRKNGWPERCLAERPWHNVFDPLDPVCGGPDRRIASDFLRAGKTVVADVRVANKGRWRHSISKYLGQERLRELLSTALGPTTMARESRGMGK
jgi:pimeloyl-ACP methyl ester carboxylesterase